MYNYFMLIGLVYKEPETKTAKNGKTYTKVPLLVTRPFKNSNGEYDADNFTFLLWDALSDIATYLKKGSKVGIKGRIQCRYVTTKDDVLVPAHELVPERIISMDSFYDEDDEQEEKDVKNSELVPEDKENIPESNPSDLEK